MGGCCARQQEVYFDKKNCFQYSTDEIIKIKSVIKPELNSDKKRKYKSRGSSISKNY